MKLAKPQAIYAMPLRTARIEHSCYLCSVPILRGDRYFDGGERRAHLHCVKMPASWTQKLKPKRLADG